jgi:hypothetical protein
MHDQAVTTRRVRHQDTPWLLRYVVLVLGIPLLSAAVVLPLADASDNWLLLAGVVMVLQRTGTQLSDDVRRRLVAKGAIDLRTARWVPATLGSTVVLVSEVVVVGVRFPFEGEARADDEEWLQELAGSCGAEWPEVMSASMPGQVGLGFPTVEAADRFVLGLQREGRFSKVRRTVL